MRINVRQSAFPNLAGRKTYLLDDDLHAEAKTSQTNTAHDGAADKPGNRDGRLAGVSYEDGNATNTRKL